jgi:membrane protease YdiL (CAAX protease family)
VTIIWPPAPLGIGTTFNIALLSRETRSQLTRSWWLIPVAGLLTALAMLAADLVFFGGATMGRTPDLSSHPPIGSRVLVSIIGSLGEELIFRVGLATATAWVAYSLIGSIVAAPRRLAQVTGIIIAALAVGALAVGVLHVNQVGQPAEFARVMTVNCIGHSVHGLMYWSRGLEAAVLTHMIVTLILYIGIPALR